MLPRQELELQKDNDKDEADYDDFLEDLEEDKEYRQNVKIFKVSIYRKISNISPGLIFDFGTFLGLYSRGLIFEGDYIQRVFFA